MISSRCALGTDGRMQVDDGRWHGTEQVVVILPVYHPDARLHRCLAALRAQEGVAFRLHVVVTGTLPEEFLPDLAALPQTRIMWIAPAAFNHGGTRWAAAQVYGRAAIFVYLTQDAVLADGTALDRLVRVFRRPQIGCAYGRQLPQADASPVARFARAFNYGARSQVRSFADRERYGVKAAFLSNSFAAYRGEALVAVGGFPTQTILCEDMYVAAKMLMAGWQVAYVAEAEAYHSHDYTLLQEARRYFDFGVFHARERWIQQTFGKAEGEGVRFVREEARFLLREAPWLLPSMVLRDGLKFLSYRLGRLERYLPLGVKRRISMTKSFWERRQGESDDDRRSR